MLYSNPRDYSVNTNMYFSIPSTFSLILQNTLHLATIHLFLVSMRLLLFLLLMLLFFRFYTEVQFYGNFCSQSDLFPLALYPLSPSTLSQWQDHIFWDK